MKESTAKSQQPPTTISTLPSTSTCREKNQVRPTYFEAYSTSPTSTIFTVKSIYLARPIIIPIGSIEQPSKWVGIKEKIRKRLCRAKEEESTAPLNRHSRLGHRLSYSTGNHRTPFVAEDQLSESFESLGVGDSNRPRIVNEVPRLRLHDLGDEISPTSPTFSALIINSNSRSNIETYDSSPASTRSTLEMTSSRSSYTNTSVSSVLTSVWESRTFRGLPRSTGSNYLPGLLPENDRAPLLCQYDSDSSVTSNSIAILEQDEPQVFKESTPVKMMTVIRARPHVVTL